MKVDCESHLGIIYFSHGEVWRNIPIYEWHDLMEVILPKSVIARYSEIDYSGVISNKRYEAGKIAYKDICNKFRVKDTSKGE